MSGRKKITKYGKLISFLKRVYLIMPITINKILYNFFFNRSSNLATLMRYLYVYKFSQKAGENIYIAPYVVLKNLQNISFGTNISIHENCYLDGYGGIEIGNDVSIAHNSSLISFNHTYEEALIPIKYNIVSKGKIVIAEDVWIACGVRVLANSVIKKRTIIAANAVVSNKMLESGYLYGGVPVKKIKRIDKK